MKQRPMFNYYKKKFLKKTKTMWKRERERDEDKSKEKERRTFTDRRRGTKGTLSEMEWSNTEHFSGLEDVG